MMGRNKSKHDRKSEPSLYQNCIYSLQAITPFRYAQWVVEDSRTHDYLVTASVSPKGVSGYDVAHRTGVIGQVFRLGKPLFVANVRNHPFYDPFDNEMDWELTFPVVEKGNLRGVINLEGSGTLELREETWLEIYRVVKQITHYEAPLSLSEIDHNGLIKTRRIVFAKNNDNDERASIVEIARAVARGGLTTLLIGDHPDLLAGRKPTLLEANAQGLGVSYCYFGVDWRLDLLATGPEDEVTRCRHDNGWWETSSGRYDVVLLNESLEKRMPIRLARKTLPDART